MTEKTLAMHVLQGQNVNFRVVQYDPALRDAEEIAHHIGVEPSVVFKTLVVTRPAGKPFLVMVAADKQLDLKRMARNVGEKKVTMASQRDAERLTGLQVGGISALALLNRGFSICIDAGAIENETIFISAGRRGLQLELPVVDLIRVSKARVLAVTR